jgi:Lipopolysaccharide kinase (Kdo/WaaP) family.
VLFSQGIEKAEDVFNLEGIRVTGHGWKTGRHVSSVTLGSGKSEVRAFLKKEHNRGWVKSLFGQSAGVLHEARILKALEHEGIPAPSWIAVGKTSLGHSFLLVEEIPETVNLKTYFAEQRSRSQRKKFCADLLGFLHACTLLVFPMSICIRSMFWLIQKPGWSICSIGRDLSGCGIFRGI